MKPHPSTLLKYTSPLKLDLASSAVLSKTYPAAQARQDLPELLKPKGKWLLTRDGKGIERQLQFRGFKKCWEFMDTVAKECVVRKHHPEWSNVYNTAFVRWTTHSPPGLSEKDVMMARFCDEVAERCGGVEIEAQVKDGGESEDVNLDEKSLVDQCKEAAGNCCVPGNGKKAEG